eukprot:gene8744-6283_t
MAAFQNDIDSDLSDQEEGAEVTGWLDESDEEEEEPKKPPPIQEDLKMQIDIMLKSAYIIRNADLFYALCDLEDLEFDKMSDEQQEEIMRSLVVETFEPGEIVIKEGDTGNDMYIIVATQESNRTAEVEVIQNVDTPQEQFLTKLRRGQYFGQKFFLTRRVNKRGATVRVPKDSPTKVEVAKLTPDHFEKWSHFRYLLLAKAVPLIQKLPRKERSQILQSLIVREFRDGDYIVHQGEIGEDFFIIQEGSVRVVENRPSPDNPDVITPVQLVILREGAFFGEMSLVTNEPRVANVISIGNSICLSLSKSVFRAALSDESFREILDDVLSKRKVIREQRKKEEQQDAMSTVSGGDSTKASSASGMRKMSVRSRSKSFGTQQADVNVTSTLQMKKLDGGFRVINKYVIERELGKGSYGEVYLVRDLETDNYYAMKMINRPPQNSWNEDASNSIRQEIAVMKRMRHHNVVALREVIDDQNARKIFLIQEFMEKGALMPDAETCDPMDVDVARKYFRDILRGVCYLHSEGIIHRDIKPQNMLLSEDGTVKIADFGAAVFTGAQQKVAFGGTPAFMAPELFLSGTKIDFTKSPGIDVFALGATLYYMLMGRPPWMAKNQIDLAKQIRDIELNFPVPVDPSVRHLLKQMLKKDYRTRCKLDDIVNDEWVTLEGSDPLFERDETFVDHFVDFVSYAAIDDINAFNPSLKVLIVHDSLVIRTMLHNQINTQHAALCACAESCDQALSLMETVLKQHPVNFDFIFIDILPVNKNGDVLKEQGLHTVRALLSMGFKGKIIGMNATMDDVEAEFVAAGCTTVVRRPIANRELFNLLNREVAPEHANFVSAEEFEQAITLSANATLSMSPLTVGSRKSSLTESQMDLASELPDESASLLSSDSIDREDMADFMADFDACKRDIPPPVAKPATGRKSLSRKGGFMMLKGSNQMSFDDISVSQPVKFFSFKDGNKDAMLQRQERREQAMKRSQAAQQYREAKKNGDEGKSKSMLNILKQQSKKSIYERKKSVRMASNESNRSMVALKSMLAGGGGNALYADTPPGSNRPSLSSPSPTSGLVTGGGGSETSSSLVAGSGGFGGLSTTTSTVGGLSGASPMTSPTKSVHIARLEDDVQEWDHTVFGVNLANTLQAKAEHTNADLRIKFGLAEAQGTRNYMEDRIYAKALEPSRIGEGLSPLAIFGVFDGHGGDAVAQHLQNRYASVFTSAYRALETHLDFATIDPESGIYEAAVARAFEETNARIDRALLEKDYARQQKNMAAGATIGQEANFSGAVGVVAVVAPAKQHFDGGRVAMQVFISHVGDCRAVLSQDGVAKALTEDHKATNKSEKVRIEMAGGFVQNGRVNGALMVARSFGDIQHKNFAACVGHKGNENDAGGIWAENQHVISKPDFTHMFVYNDSFEFIILASDGIWDVFECQEAVNFVRKRLLTNKDLHKTAEELIQKALQRGTQDNTSCVIIAFNQ